MAPITGAPASETFDEPVKPEGIVMPSTTLLFACSLSEGSPEPGRTRPVLCLAQAMLLAPAVAVAALASPASAAVPGLERVSASSALDSAAAKSATVLCPSGKKLIGAGGQINAPAGRVILDEVTPLPDLSGVTAVGAEAEAGTTGNWRVTARAICATP